MAQIHFRKKGSGPWEYHAIWSLVICIPHDHVTVLDRVKLYSCWTTTSPLPLLPPHSDSGGIQTATQVEPDDYCQVLGHDGSGNTSKWSITASQRQMCVEFLHGIDLVFHGCTPFGSCRMGGCGHRMGGCGHRMGGCGHTKLEHGLCVYLMIAPSLLLWSPNETALCISPVQLYLCSHTVTR